MFIKCTAPVVGSVREAAVNASLRLLWSQSTGAGRVLFCTADTGHCVVAVSRTVPVTLAPVTLGDLSSLAAVFHSNADAAKVGQAQKSG